MKRIPQRLISSLLIEAFLFSNLLPASALPTDSLRPRAVAGASLISALEDTAARDGGKLTLPAPQERRVLGSYQELVDEILEEIASRRKQKGKGQFWVGITGASALGKGYLNDALEERLKASGIHVIRLLEDMWVVDRTTRNEWAKRNDPRAYEHEKYWIRWDELQKALRTVRETVEGKATLEHLYNREEEGRANLTRDIEVVPDAVVLYDGLYLADEARYPSHFFDTLVLLDASEQERIQRHKERDIKFGRSPDETEALLERMYEPQWKAHVASAHPEKKADLVYDITSFEHPIRLLYEKQDLHGKPWTVERLDELLRSVDRRSPQLRREYGFDFDDPKTYFSLHIGAHVPHLEPRLAPIHLFHRAQPVARYLHDAGIKLYSVSIRVPAEPLGHLQEFLEAARQHPKVLMVTVTQPHKTSVGQWVDARDEAAYPTSPVNYVAILRDEKGSRTIGTNTDGMSWVEEYKKRWGRRGEREGRIQGKRIVILGGWGGIGQALTLSILKESPESLTISEVPSRVAASRQELRDVIQKLRKRKGDYKTIPEVTVVPAFDAENPERDHPDLFSSLRHAQIVINATGIGMDQESSPIRDSAVFRPEMEVFDAIYHTKEGRPIGLTPFLRQAKERGAKVFNGTGIVVRNRSLSADWLVQQLTGRRLTPGEKEEVYREVYRYEQETRGLLEADAAPADSGDTSAAEDGGGKYEGVTGKVREIFREFETRENVKAATDELVALTGPYGPDVVSSEIIGVSERSSNWFARYLAVLALSVIASPVGAGYLEDISEKPDERRAIRHAATVGYRRIDRVLRLSGAGEDETVPDGAARDGGGRTDPGLKTEDQRLEATRGERVSLGGKTNELVFGVGIDPLRPEPVLEELLHRQHRVPSSQSPSMNVFDNNLRLPSERDGFAISNTSIRDSGQSVKVGGPASDGGAARDGAKRSPERQSKDGGEKSTNLIPSARRKEISKPILEPLLSP